MNAKGSRMGIQYPVRQGWMDAVLHLAETRHYANFPDENYKEGPVDFATFSPQDVLKALTDDNGEPLWWSASLSDDARAGYRLLYYAAQRAIELYGPTTILALRVQEG